MTHAAIAADLGQALDVHRQVAAQVALYGVIAGDDLTQLGLFLVGEVLHAGIGVDSGLLQDFIGAGASNAEDIGESDLHPLILRQINSGNTCHITLAPPLTLSLLMFGVLADDHDFALALDDLALLAHGLDRRSDFHIVNLL